MSVSTGFQMFDESLKCSVLFVSVDHRFGLLYPQDGNGKLSIRAFLLHVSHQLPFVYQFTRGQRDVRREA